MRNIFKGRLTLAVLLSLLLLVSGTSAVVYANEISGKDIATQKDIHLYSAVQLSNGSVPPGKDCPITGNIFTFTHFVEGNDYQEEPVIYGTPDSGCVAGWSSSNTATQTETGKLSGSFYMDKNPAPLGWDTGNYIYVSFNTRSYYVPPYGQYDVPCYNFVGTFKITGGTGFYEGIQGSGNIGGTFHDHEWGGDLPHETWFDFVMIGKVQFPGR
jgi:hypothetical protein